MLSVLIFLPLAGGLAALMPRRRGRRPARGVRVAAGRVATLGLAIACWPASTAASGLQYVDRRLWISELGIHYTLGVDGLNLFLSLLTTLLWAGATLAAPAARLGAARGSST